MKKCNRCFKENCEGLKGCSGCGEDLFCTDSSNLCSRCDGDETRPDDE